MSRDNALVSMLLLGPSESLEKGPECPSNLNVNANQNSICTDQERCGRKRRRSRERRREAACTSVPVRGPQIEPRRPRREERRLRRQAKAVAQVKVVRAGGRGPLRGARLGKLCNINHATLIIGHSRAELKL